MFHQELEQDTSKDSSPKTGFNLRYALRVVVIVAIYLVLIISLDWFTQKFELYPGVVAWYPPSGISFALLLALGVSYAPALIIASLFSSFFIYQLPQSPMQLFVWAAIVAFVYGSTVAILRRIRMDSQLRSMRDVLKLMLAAPIPAAILAIVSVSGSVASGTISGDNFLRATVQWWIGEIIGILVFAPVFLVYVMPGVKRFLDGNWKKSWTRASFPHITVYTIAQALSILIAIYLVFGVSTLEKFRPFYLLAIPVIWIALQYGIKGIVIGIAAINFGSTLAILILHFDITRLGELQMLMLVLAVTGLLVGAVVTERKQADAMLQKLSSAIKQTADPVVITDVDGKIEYINPAFTTVTGFVTEEVLGQTPRLVKSGTHSPAFYKKIWDTILAGDPWPGTLVNRKKDGEIYYAETTITPIISQEGLITNFVSVQKDITERKQAEKEILARTNELATLYELSRALTETDDINKTLELVNSHAVKSIHTTFARIALLEGNEFVLRSVYPVRVLNHDLMVGDRIPSDALHYCHHVLEQDEPVILRADNLEINEKERKVLLLDFAQLLCLIPLRNSSPGPNSRRALGLLMLGETRDEAREPFTPEKVRLARSIGDQASTAIRRVLLKEQTDRRLQQLAALNQIDRAITSGFDLYFSLTTLLIHVIAQLHIDAAAVLLYDSTSLTLEYAATQGFRTNAIEHKQLRLLECYAGRVVLNQQTAIIPNMKDQQDKTLLTALLAGEDFISYYGVPLISKGQVCGVLEIFHRTIIRPDDEWLNFLNALAEQAAIAIDNAMLFDGLQRSNTKLSLAYDDTIEGWSRALDLRDKETEGHTQRVTEMTVKLGRAFGFSQAELVQVRRGALLHDIGKMGVPDGILLKPGPLTDEEWVIMKKHPVFAYEMLSPISYLLPALDIPYCHHEKWDGTGYPRGLKGEQIPLVARIFSVIDIWDALTSDRPYRAAWSTEKVLEHIRSLAGTHLDPKVVKTCLESGLFTKR